MKDSSQATVVIVGRPNVGKSSLFNQLIRRRLSISHSKAGVTRDRVASELRLSDSHALLLVDTGGLGGEDPKGLDLVSQQEKAFDEADIFIFVTDVRQGLTAEDRRIARKIRTKGKKVILIVNKVDGAKQYPGISEFFELGFDEVIPYSVHEGLGREDLFKALEALTPKAGPVDMSSWPRVVFLGRRNVGKSTLMNQLCGEDRVLVSDVAGTTRDFIEVPIKKYAHPFIAVDTAGMKKEGFEDPADFFSVARTKRAVKEASAALLILDATEKIGEIDKKLASLIAEKALPTVICLNKWDLVPDDVSTKDYVTYLESEIKGLSYAPIAFISAKSGLNIKQMLKTLWDLIGQAKGRIETGPLNRLIKDLVARRSPPQRGGKQAKLLYASQVTVSPPTFVIMCNDGRLVTKQYRRYIENHIRNALGDPEIPLKIIFRGQK